MRPVAYRTTFLDPVDVGIPSVESAAGWALLPAGTGVISAMAAGH